MLKWWIRRQIAAFERTYDYDLSHALEILDIDLAALIKFSKVMGLDGYRKNVPKAPWFAAKLAGTMAEDCGTCTQLVVTMAEREGVAPDVLRAVLAQDVGAMPDDVALAFRFAQAVLARSAEADTLREQVVARWGGKGLVSLAFAITASRLFPTLKYGMGHGHACTRITVDGSVSPVAHVHS
jgi:hypothetical protein